RQPQDADAGAADRLGEEMVGAVGLEAEHLVGEVEGRDLPAAVGQQAVDAHGAELDLVEIAALLALGVDLLPGGEEDGRLRAGAEGRADLPADGPGAVRTRRYPMRFQIGHDRLPMLMTINRANPAEAKFGWVRRGI